MTDQTNLHDSTTARESASTATHDRLTRRVICRARGLSQDHNATTAFIDIPIGAPHGLLLVCSHMECAKSQRRFSYCSGRLIG
jgi:hypothetical protein